jgi:hypothetical protein
MLQWIYATNNPRTMVYILLGSGLLSIVSLILAIVSAVRTSRLNHRYEKLVNGEDGSDIEQVLLKNHQQVNAFLVQIKALREQVDDQEVRLRRKAEKPSILRYNAFGEPGNDLSFSLSLVDETGAGAVVSSIFGREESRVYAKPVMAGNSPYTLTEEEKRVIQDSVRLALKD